MQPSSIASMPLYELLRPELGILATAIVDLDRRTVLASAAQPGLFQLDFELLSELPRDLLTAASSLEKTFLEATSPTSPGAERFEEVVLHADGGVLVFLSLPDVALGLMALLSPAANVGTSLIELRTFQRQLSQLPPRKARR